MNEMFYELQEMSEACNDVRCIYDGDPTGEDLINALDGDENQIEEFKLTFSDLNSDIEKLQADLDETVYEELGELGEYGEINIFDMIFAVYQNTAGEMLGYDEYVGDYFPLNSYATELALEEAEKRLERLTKKELIRKMKICGAIMVNYVGIRERYNNLSAAIDILRAENAGLTRAVKDISEAYEKAEKASGGFKRLYDVEEVDNFDRLLDRLPEAVWIR
ncbi:MAG: hypothetical protein LUC92_08400 [Clostridiales bacterium]|nr:hypothetical protein [Clostridiales bacterium]